VDRMNYFPIPAQTLAGLLLESALKWSDRVAIKFPGFAWTYGQLAGEALEVAKCLRGLGVGRGDHVGLLLPNGPDFLRAYFGVALASAVSTTLNVRYRQADLTYVIAKSNIRILVLSASHRDYFDFEGLVSALIQEGRFPKLEKVVVLGATDAGPFITEAHAAASAKNISADAITKDLCCVSVKDPCSMLFTSGTTARAKACVLSHEAIVRTASSWSQYGVRISEYDKVWNPNPLFHIGALTTLVASISRGACFLSMPYFDADMAVDMLSSEDVSVFFPVFDSLAMAILDHRQSATVRTERIRYCFTIGNPTNIERMKAWLPQAHHFNVYGQTETSGWCIFNHNMAAPGGPAAGGYPIPGVEMKLGEVPTATTQQGHSLGEICIRSWCTMTEYYEDPQATARAIDKDGWLHTGDLGWLGDDGSLNFHGRLGEMLKVGGENVAPAELEELIGSHEAVRTAVVVGVMDPRLGEVPAAFIELNPGFELEEKEVFDFCNRQVARFKVPRYVRFVTSNEWPMSATKIQKFELRARLEREVFDANEIDEAT